jgi:hypothetical protein
MAKTNIYVQDGRTFEVTTVNVACFHNFMAETYVHEVIRPNWKIFRTRSIDSQSFFVDDYETILDGEIAMLEKILQREREEKERRQKWAEFDK